MGQKLDVKEWQSLNIVHSSPLHFLNPKATEPTHIPINDLITIPMAAINEQLLLIK